MYFYNTKMSFYIRIICDIIDDDNVFHYIISFDNKNDAEIFKSKFDKTKFQFSLWIATIRNNWLRSFELKPNLERPIKTSKECDFINILNIINNHLVELESLRFVDNMPYINDNILLKREYIDNIDEDELKLYMVANSGKQNLDNFVIILNEEEYDKIFSNAPILSHELKHSIDFTEPSYILIYWHQVFEYKEFILINRYERITPYDKASNKYNLWNSIFDNDPYKFTQNENIIMDFSQELIEKMDNEINIEPSIFKNKYIYPQYTKYLKELLNKK